MHSQGKRLLTFVFSLSALVLSGASFAQYADRPAGLTAKGAAVIEAYAAKAKKTFGSFDHELQTPKGRRFFVITKIYQDKLYEQVFVEVQARTDKGYRGKIATTPTGAVKFAPGDVIDVPSEQAVDWCILLPNGEETGNVTGKALDALMGGAVGFIIEMKPEKDRFVGFKVVDVFNPKTQQKIPEIAQAEVVAAVEAEAARRFAKLVPNDDKPKFQFILTSFPAWKILPP